MAQELSFLTDGQHVQTRGTRLRRNGQVDGWMTCIRKQVLASSNAVGQLHGLPPLAGPGLARIIASRRVRLSTYFIVPKLVGQVPTRPGSSATKLGESGSGGD